MKRIDMITSVVIVSVLIITADAYDGPNRSVEPSRDVAVTNMSAPSICVQGDTAPVIVTIENQGNCTESLVVKLTDTTNGKATVSKSVTLSAVGSDGLDEVADLILTGQVENTQYGNHNFTGDVNGDGYDDLLVAGGSRYNNSQGYVCLYFGGKNMDVTPDWIFTGEAPGHYFGEGASLGDLNGDGYSDVIVGSLGYNDEQGRAYIYYGGTDMDSNPDVILDGEQGKGGRFGRSISAGDVNGDGYGDVFVGAYYYNNKQGRVYLFYGGDPMDPTADKIFDGENEGDQHGRDLFGQNRVGDVNGDGYGDILMGTRWWNKRQGRAYLYYGGPDMDNKPDKIFAGESVGNDFGISGALSDIDNNGYADVIIGARNYNKYKGRAYLYWGGTKMDVDADKTFDVDPNDKAGLGSASIACGYVNNDYYKDILIAGSYYPDAASHHGRAYLFYGNTKEDMDEACDRKFTLPQEDNRPQSVALGDFSKDGFSDVVMGGWKYNNFQGRVWLYYSNPPSSTDVKFDWNTSNASTGEHTLKAEIVPVAGEKNTTDNSKTITVNVKSSVKGKK